MLLTKRLADALTWGRALLAGWLAWLGLTQGAAALPVVVALMVLEWTADSLDGPLARRAPQPHHTWIGDHDLEVDVLVSLGLLAYLSLGGWVRPVVAGLYLTLWALIFLVLGYRRVLGELIQAPTYAVFIWIALHEAPHIGWVIPVWMVAAIALTWPRFPEEKVKGFLHEMGALLGWRR